MRLIHFTASKGWRGHEQKIIYLYEAFRDFGYCEDQWIVCREGSDIHKIASDKGLQTITFEYKSEYDFKLAKRLRKIAGENRADLVFIHNSQSHTIAVLSAVFCGLKTPLVLCRTMIKKIDTNFFRKWKYNYRGIKKIICVSQPVVDVLKPAIHDHSRLCIVGSVTDLKKYDKKDTGILRREFNIPADYKIIGNVSAFVPVKDHVTWVGAVEELKRRGLKAKYILIGDGPLEAEIKEFVKSKSLENDVIFAGFRKDVPEIWPELDLFLFTSSNEATGSVVLEAYASRVPSVAARAGGTFEVLVDGETGFLAEAKNPVDFADKAEMILSNNLLRNNMIEKGYEFLKANFTKEVISKKMFDELDAVLKASKK
ncbi:MAG: glycosyltransferase family 1 protein [Flavobacterium sp.]|nr:MAG: glycosyltransferase family 1 protein [Flavobacterium sp.]